MSLLAPCYPWWRYPVKRPNPRTLDQTRLKRAIYPVGRFSKAECGAYVPEKAKEGYKGRLKEIIKKGKRRKTTKRYEACKLVIPGTWTFLGAGCHYTERWKFTEAPKRKCRPVPPSLKVEWKRRHNLPAWRGPARLYRINGKVEGFRPAQFEWKPDRRYYFGAWEQHRYVRWTRTPRPSGSDLRHFTGRK